MHTPANTNHTDASPLAHETAMPWVQYLKGISASLLARHQLLQDKLDAAERARARAARLRLEATTEAQELQAHVATHWSEEEISAAIRGVDQALCQEALTNNASANLAKLPERCYCVFPSLCAGQRIVLVKAGERGYLPTGFDKHSLSIAELHQVVDSLNAYLGVTRAQANAMRTGSIFGFQVPGANPEMHADRLSEQLR